MALRRVVVYGGKGALGATIVSHFKTNNWVTVIFYKNLITDHQINQFYLISVGRQH